ncbi:MAG: 16S rRNA (cytidine(1402)-2'-O)-methyltransferase [Nitrospinota bacterium]
MATPIGNLEDITLRALRVMREVDLIAAEDTRRTGKLLSHYSICTPLTSYHDHNKERRTPRLVEGLLKGSSIALVSDAGTPGISDPAYYLVRRCLDRGVPVVPVPGPSAVAAALSAAGLPTNRFSFEGFLPPKGEKRRRRLMALREERQTLVLYESPYRVIRLLGEIAEVMGDREVAIARELTKLHEEFIRGRAGELAERLKGRKITGECVVLIRGLSSREKPSGEGA